MYFAIDVQATERNGEIQEGHLFYQLRSKVPEAPAIIRLPQQVRGHLYAPLGEKHDLQSELLEWTVALVEVFIY